MLTEAESDRLLKEWNGSEKLYPAGKCIHELFTEEADASPGSLALLFGDQSITYGEMSEKVGALAALLQNEYNVKKDTIVGLVLERSIELVVAIYAILKAGGAYLPIDPSSPKERIRFILEDSQTKLLLTQEKFFPLVQQVLTAEHRGLVLDSIEKEPGWTSQKKLREETDDRRLVYVTYTSGSTGQPKGVQVEHRSLMNTLLDGKEGFPTKKGEVWLLRTHYTFDVFALEVFSWCLTGGTLSILPPGLDANPVAIAEEMSRTNVTHVCFVPSTLIIFMERIGPQLPESWRSIKYVILGGEQVPSILKENLLRLFPNLRIINIYGPTEAAIYTTRANLHECSDGGRIPIGKPIPNAKVYVLDQTFNHSSVDVPGELFIGGPGLARGYMNRPDLTRERFIPDLLPDSGISRLYRTGDLVKWRSDGNLEFLGRIDSQVKVRGYRIELEEIENVLLRQNEVRECAVAVHQIEEGDARLVAYVVRREIERPVGQKELRSYLRERLPAYMVPGSFVFVEKLPLTASGKLDRKALQPR